MSEARFGRHRRGVVDRPVAGENSFPQQRVRFELGRELEVAVLKTGVDATLEHRRQIVDVDHLDDALHQMPRSEPQTDRSHHAEQPIPADRGAKQLRVFGSTAAADNSIGAYHRERGDVADERGQFESAAVHIRRQRTSDAQLVSAGLLLDERPAFLVVLLAVEEIFVQLRPLNAGFDFDFTVDAVELDDAGEAVHVDECRARRELLAAHGVSATGNADRSAVSPGRANRRLHRVGRIGTNDAAHPRRVEVRVYVVDIDAAGVGAGQRARLATR